jgi:hypothetical protein
LLRLTLKNSGRYAFIHPKGIEDIESCQDSSTIVRYRHKNRISIRSVVVKETKTEIELFLLIRKYNENHKKVIDYCQESNIDYDNFLVEKNDTINILKGRLKISSL